MTGCSKAAKLCSHRTFRADCPVADDCVLRTEVKRGVLYTQDTIFVSYPTRSKGIVQLLSSPAVSDAAVSWDHQSSDNPSYRTSTDTGSKPCIKACVSPRLFEIGYKRSPCNCFHRKCTCRYALRSRSLSKTRSVGVCTSDRVRARCVWKFYLGGHEERKIFQLCFLFLDLLLPPLPMTGHVRAAWARVVTCPPMRVHVMHWCTRTNNE